MSDGESHEHASGLNRLSRTMVQGLANRHSNNINKGYRNKPSTDIPTPVCLTEGRKQSHEGEGGTEGYRLTLGLTYVVPSRVPRAFHGYLARYVTPISIWALSRGRRFEGEGGRKTEQVNEKERETKGQGEGFEERERDGWWRQEKGLVVIETVFGWHQTHGQFMAQNNSSFVDAMLMSISPLQHVNHSLSHGVNVL